MFRSPVFSKREGSRYSLVGERKLRGGFMEIVMKNGITIFIDDDEVVDWACNFKGTVCHIRLKDGSIWNYSSVDGSFCKSK